MHAIMAEERASLYDSYCNANIYNAFLITKYRKDLQKKDFDFIERDLTYGLGVLAYLTAFIQWIALCTLLLALFNKTAQTLTEEAISYWSAWPSNPSTLFIWPFFMIGLYSTYKQFSQIWVDIHTLREWNIKKNQCHVLFFKYVCELILYTGGSFLFYVILSLYSKAGVKTLDVVLKLLSYQFIFQADEWAYQLVSDIVKRRIIPEQCNQIFKGKRLGRIYRFEMMIYISIPFSMSLIIQGIYSQSYIILLIGVVSTITWTLDSIEKS
eukprot:732019_1